MAQQLGQVAVGSIVKLNENGSPVNYIVVHQGLPSSSYDSSCDGTWLLRKDIIENRVWDSGNVNKLEESDIQSWLNSTMLGKFDSNIQNAIKQVKIPYRQNGGSGGTDRNGANGLSCKIFLLSGKEVGWDSSDNPDFPNDGAKLSYFLDGTGSSANQKRVATLNGSATDWWLRSPRAYGTDGVWRVVSDGLYNYRNAGSSNGVRPAFTLLSDLSVLDDGTIIVPPNPPAAMNVPQLAMQGNQLSVSWSAVDGADGYILERKANTDADWTQVYSGANTSFEETVGTWTSVQYRVKAGVSGTYGDYTTSASVPVVSASAVVISGTDGDLGTLTSDVSYTVSSNGDTALTVVETINGVERTFTAINGATNKISVVDLATGYGTISIQASTNPGSGVVSVERNWMYTKAAITFPDAGSVADLTQQGKTIWAKTIAEAVRTPSIWGGNLGLALQKLMGAVLYNPTQVAKYTEVTVNLANVSVGQEVNLPYNGQMVPHIVVHIGNPNPSLYDASCDGVWLLRKDIVENGQWNSSGVNTLPNSTIMQTMAGYVANYASDVQAAIKTVKIPYCIGGGSATVNAGTNGLECKVFPISQMEAGGNTLNSRPQDGAILDYFQDADYSKTGAPSDWLTRTPDPRTTNEIYAYSSDGYLISIACTDQNGIRPVFIMPTTFTATYYVGTDGSVHASQEYEEAGTFTDIFGGAIPMVSIENGIYTGTGTYGENNPNRLTFKGKPIVVFIVDHNDPSSNHLMRVWMFPCFAYNRNNNEYDDPGYFNIAESFGNGYGQPEHIFAKVSRTTLMWYGEDSADDQINQSTYRYYYFALTSLGGAST